LKLPLITIFFLLLNIKNESNFVLNKKTYQKWYDIIKPSKEDLAWTNIPWLTTFEAGIKESIDQEKPLLLWVMNGHPLGCT